MQRLYNKVSTTIRPSINIHKYATTSEQLSSDLHKKNNKEEEQYIRKKEEEVRSKKKNVDETIVDNPIIENKNTKTDKTDKTSCIIS